MKLHEMLTEIHRRAAASPFGVWEISEYQLTEHEIALIEEAELAGLIDKEVRFDLSDLYRISLTDHGRKQYNFPMIKRRSLMDIARSALSIFGVPARD
ncbi:hypothetical protein [Rhizobium sp. GCM10022189]|uniref:hypothetical protein n=1 Tax=Rhizobium sp. GCM10022189 TaxID=3252654 RepID=UPI003616EA55